MKKNPTEKENIFRRLTEKEIKEQLYGFQAKQPPAPKEDLLVKPVKKEENQQQPPQKTPAEKNASLKNKYLIAQILLLVVFLILIWFSLRQIIRIISQPRNAATEAQKPAQVSKNSHYTTKIIKKK